MFGLSFTKLIFTAIVVFAAWQGFKYFSKLSVEREKRAKMARKNPKPSDPGVEEMVKCSKCDAYVASGSKSCGKDGCPFRG